MTVLDRGSAAHVAVVGGGIAGLAAANRLLARDPALRVTLLEAEGRLGGKIATERADGFVVEGGPDSFLAAKPRGVGLCGELGIGDELQGITPRLRRAYVARGEAMHELPEGLSGLVPTRLGPLFRSHLLSPRGKLRLAMDYRLPARPGDGDESLGGFVRRRLGDEAWERLVEPLMAGIYAGDGDRLSLLATFPQLRAAEVGHGGLIRGVVAARSAAASAQRPGPAFVTPRRGLDHLVEALADRLRAGGAELRTGVAVRGVAARVGAGEADGATLLLDDGGRLEADAVVVATPAFVAGDLLAGLEAGLAADLRAIPHASSAIVTLAYRREAVARPLDAHGYLVPRAEASPILACTWSSEKWAGRAPAGWALLRVFVGRFGQEALFCQSDDELLALARAEVGRRLGATGEPGLARVRRWPQGMPQYLVGHGERVARIKAAAGRFPWLALAGNAYRGVGIPDCIASGEAAAEAVLGGLAKWAERSFVVNSAHAVAAR